MRIRTISPDEWHIWRGLRLDALREAPYAFATKLKDWEGAGDTEARWRARLHELTFNAIAEVDGVPSGMVGGMERDNEVQLLNLWVAPHARGQGVSDALVEAVIAWARSRRAEEVSLGVWAGNDHAFELYRRHGFVDVEPIRGDASNGPRKHQMVLRRL